MGKSRSFRAATVSSILKKRGGGSRWVRVGVNNDDDKQQTTDNRQQTTDEHAHVGQVRAVDVLSERSGREVVFDERPEPRASVEVPLVVLGLVDVAERRAVEVGLGESDDVI